jgi:hypothetical protein
MLGARAVSGLILVGAGLLSLCSSLAEIDSRPVTQSWHPDRLHPVSALAWAQAHCDSSLSLSLGTPRLQAEDLLEMTAHFDAIDRELGRRQACAKALMLAAEVSEDAREPEAADADTSGALAAAN